MVEPGVMEGGEKHQARDGGRASSTSCESVLRQELSVCHPQMWSFPEMPWGRS